MSERKRGVMVEEELNEDISWGRKCVFFAAGGRSGVVSREQALDVCAVRSRPPFNRRISQQRLTWLIKYDRRWLHGHASSLNWFPPCCSSGGGGGGHLAAAVHMLEVYERDGGSLRHGGFHTGIPGGHGNGSPERQTVVFRTSLLPPGGASQYSPVTSCTAVVVLALQGLTGLGDGAGP
ncbi:hypothetical protein EYF80_049025 [Liparis tanakae]|uniref:Uncharacterized protein n=1 Tax=Liparis tanakae TaxID=230148 RepID=A0A4Z2FKK6_9TELE|nr:hypothetical protein EYF80_049025 [Liparis tanakae]